MKKAPKFVAVKVRMSPALKGQAERLAKRLNISMNQLMQAATRDAVRPLPKEEQSQDAAKRRATKESKA